MYSSRERTYTQYDVDYYRRQAEDAQDALERHHREEREAQDRRRRERQEMYEERLRTADNWPDALRNQATLFGRETDLDNEADQYFTHGRDACDRALEIYHETEQEIQPQIDELQRQIDRMQFVIRQRTGERLATEAEGKSSSWQQVADVLQDENSDIDSWLYW